jgi:hypothetical protein
MVERRMTETTLHDSRHDTFHETHRAATPIRELGLTIVGSQLEPLVARVRGELHRLGFVRLAPRFYLSTEWGVPFGTIAVAIPFYLARADLVAHHGERTGHVEGTSDAEILRYLRHELGHVVNYAYRLHEDPRWTALFGPIDRPYVEEYRPEPFSRRYVRHLPGWYAQKHPDEDWAETFAVFLGRGRAALEEYASWPLVREKLDYVAHVTSEIGDRPPLVVDDTLDEDAAEIEASVDEFYRALAEPETAELPLAATIAALFDDLRVDGEGASLGSLVRALERPLIAEVYRWTGHFPEHTRRLLRHLAARAEAVDARYARDRDREATSAIASYVTSLAMNHVHRGVYAP